MPKFAIRAAPGGHLGGLDLAEWEVIDAPDIEAAKREAREVARTLYEAHPASPTVAEIMDWQGVDRDTALETWIEERDSLIEFEAVKHGEDQ